MSRSGSAPSLASAAERKVPLARASHARRALSTARAPAPLDAQGTFYMTLMFLWVFYRAKEDGAVMLGLIHPWDAHGGHGHGDHGHDDEEHEEDEEEEE